MPKKSHCVECQGLNEKLKKAVEELDSESARIAYDQMREHRIRVKYPALHYFTRETMRTKPKTKKDKGSV